MKLVVPQINDPERYRELFLDDSVWDPFAHAIASRHGLEGSAVRQRMGSNIVYRIGAVYMKLMAPIWVSEFEAEKAVTAFVHGKLGVATPEILATDSIEGFPYLILSVVKGTPIGEVWTSLGAAQRAGFGAQLGRLASKLHAVDQQSIADHITSWGTIRTECQAGLAAHHAQTGLPDSWLGQIVPFVDRQVAAGALDSWDDVLLNADLTEEHVFVDFDGNGGIRISGLIDFADAFIGDPRYEIFAMTIGALSCDPVSIAFCLDEYDWGAAGRPSAEVLMTFALLHRFCDLNLVVGRFPGATTLEELASELWGVQTPVDGGW